MYLGLEGMLWGGRRAVVVAVSMPGMAWSGGVPGATAGSLGVLVAVGMVVSVSRPAGMAWSRGMLGVVAVTRAVGVSREMGVEALSVGPAGRKHLATGIHINP